MRRYKVGALFMEPGEGKTLPAYRLVKSVPDVDYLLWLAPFSSVHAPAGVHGTRYELDKYGGFDCPHDIVGVESLSASDRLYLALHEKLEAARNAFVVMDESGKIKNYEARRTRRIIRLGQLAEYRLILNGTPITRNLMDIWAQMEFLSPKILSMPLSQFKNIFCEYTVMRKRVGGRTITREWIEKYHNIDYLYSLIEHYIYEADLIIDTTEQFTTVNYDITPDEKHEYEHLKNKYLDNDSMELRNNNIFLEMTQKMQHSYSCSPDKFATVDRLLAGHDKNKVIIFCKFISSRLACEARFPGVTVLSYQKHAFSLNLQDHDTIIFFDHTWDFACVEQARHRIYRRGQQSKVCRYFTLHGSPKLENLMANNNEKKRSALQYFKSKTIEDLREEL